jgi:hypothetical protein
MLCLLRSSDAFCEWGGARFHAAGLPVAANRSRLGPIKVNSGKKQVSEERKQGVAAETGPASP